jgi:oxygen-independent coproporphyrinogen III oxidase
MDGGVARESRSRPLGPSRIPADLLRRYQTNGPRYTSYPTAPQFRQDLDWDEVLRRWSRGDVAAPTGRGPRPLSLYVHIPFCQSRCTYCGCFTRTGADASEMVRYVGAVLDNADWTRAVLASDRPVEQLSLGGGTPTSLPPTLLGQLVRGLTARFELAPGSERAIEIDPRRVEVADLDALLDLGFNRFSFGVQDLDPLVQRLINRTMPPEKLVELVGHLGARGRRSINIDLIYGLPGQTESTFAATVRRVIALRPSRVATFGYAHVPWVSPHQSPLEAAGLPGPEARMALFGLAYDLLVESGYRHVGMDHFALPDDELIQALERRTLTRTFMGYTTRRGLDLVPLGASAIGAVAATYVQNSKGIEEYVESRGVARWARGYVLSGEDELRRDIILDLLCNFHLDIPAVEARHGIDFASHFTRELAELEPLADDGLVSVDERAIAVTEIGRFFARNISMVFDAYLRREDEASQRYSKTI